MELMKSARRHGSTVSEIIYIVLNVALVAMILLLIKIDLVVLSYALVVLSKWRVLAVRPRYWWDNIQTNLLDMLFGVSIVSFMWQLETSQRISGGEQALFVQLGMAIMYIIWLTVIKPRSGHGAVKLQALLGQLFAISALYSIAYGVPAFFIVIGMWVIGYITAQHVLNLYDESSSTLLSMVWALIIAELGWLAYHWTVAYDVFGTSSYFQIPQIAVIVGLLSFFSANAYTLYKERTNMKWAELAIPGAFVATLVLVVLVFFNSYQQ